MTKKDASGQDPLEFVRQMWSGLGFSLPGMMTPTLDVDELDKRIADMKAVENWLKMNLNMLQMTVQGLEMQRATLAAVKAMSEQAAEADRTGQTPPENPFAASTMWPWNLMHPEPPAKPEKATPQPEPSPRTGERRKSSPPDK